MSDDELVEVLAEDGSVLGVVDRRRMRTDNLLHRATGVILRDPAGRVYVHRRTDTKDLFPGRYDCCAGGVVGVGEDVLAAAERELAEELGVRGVPLRPLLVGRYEDAHTRYIAHVYEAVWDGPVTWQADEVAWGAWMSPTQLRALLADPDRRFVPDTEALLGDWIADA
ncbi:MAG: NUDIX domain-containing protein [Actinomycetota bacterium]|nr:NUDIX domain-containing protein [Actinomycetota bacterium]